MFWDCASAIRIGTFTVLTGRRLEPNTYPAARLRLLQQGTTVVVSAT
jgi:hypothetical protein